MNMNESNSSGIRIHVFSTSNYHTPGEWTSALSNLLSFCRNDEEVEMQVPGCRGLLAGWPWVFLVGEC